MRQIAIGIISVLALPAAAQAQLDGAAIPGAYIAFYDGDGAAATAAARRAGGRIVLNHPASGILIVESAPSAFSSTLSATPGVSGVVADRWVVHSRPSQTEAATLAGLPAGQSAGGASPFAAALLANQWNIFRTSTDAAWGLTQGAAAVTVAVVDTGICAHHVDLAGKIDAGLSASFVPPGDEPPDTVAPACVGCPAWEDRNGHGTWVASIVSTNNAGIAGVAPNVRLVAVKVANHRGVGSVSALIRGIVYAADAGVDVINVSRAFGEHPIREFPRGMALLQRMLAYAARQGALVVFGAGNHGVDLDRAGNRVAVPCEMTNGMCIGATTVSDALASYSNHGVSGVTMVAPGGGVPTNPFPETLLNEHVLVACSVHAIDTTCSPRTYFVATGTSFAAPMVSGAAALVISRYPQLKRRPHQVKAVLVNSADDLGAPGTDRLFSKGRLNTFRALQ